MDLVREQRLRRGWSQQHLADVARIGRATLQRIERGKTQPSPETALALADALDMPVVSIRGGAGLRAAVLRAAEIALHTALTERQLRRLPADIADVFRVLSAARREFHEAMSTSNQVIEDQQRLLAEQRARPAFSTCNLDDEIKFCTRQKEQTAELGKRQLACVRRSGDALIQLTRAQGEVTLLLFRFA